MKSLRHFFTSALSLAVLLCATPAYAQSSFFDVERFYGEPIPASDGRFIIDSFFDIDTSLEGLLNDPCIICESIAQDIEAVKLEIEGLQADLETLDGLMSSMEKELETVDEALSKARADLAEFNDPQNYVESEGRRYDSSDHAAMQRRSANLWSQYQSGKLTAQEYSDEIGKPFDDPSVQRELKKIKKQLKKEMEKSIKDLEQRKADGEAKLKEWDELGQEMAGDLDALQAELEQLMQALEECEKQCKEAEVNPEDFGLTPTPTSWVDSFFDIFTNLTKPEPPVIPGLGDFLDQITGKKPIPGIPTELIPLELSGGPIPVNPIPGIDLGLNFGPETPEIPEPVCQACDPIWQQIVEFEEDLANLEWQQTIDDLLVEVLYDEKGKAQDAKSDLEDRLEELNNPPNFVESEGRRYDSNTHRAMKVRNARLWAEYKAGDLSAQELSDEWEKDFDDPDVQRELDDIIDDMKEDIEEAIDDLEEAIDELNEEIQEVTDELIDIAGRIGGLNVLLDHLYDQLDECERKCSEPQLPDLSGLFDGFDDIFKEFNESLKELEESEADDDDDTFQELTFDDLVIPPGATSIDMEDLIKKSNQYDPTTGLVIIDGKRYRIGPGGTLISEGQDEEDDMDIEIELPESSSSSSSEESSSEIGMRDDEDDMDVMSNDDGLLCGWFGWFCPQPDISDIIGCTAGSKRSVCGDLNWDETVEDDMDIDTGFEPQFFLKGPGDSEFPLIINGMDGNDDLSADDFDRFNDCIQNGPSSCSGLDFTPPPGDDILFGDDLRGVGPDDFSLGVRGRGGDDILLGDPLSRDFINVGGGSNDILRGGPSGLPDDLIGPGGDDIIGGPPGLDLLGENGNDLIGDPPPPPTQSEPNMQNDPQVRQVVQAAVQRYLQQNPLGECEKLQVQVSRVRIGNRVRYTVRITRVRDESLCSPQAQCPAETSFQTILFSEADCRSTCQNGNAGCTVIDTLPDGTKCVLCAPPSDEDDQCSDDFFCGDDDPCTEDSCTNGVCRNTEIPNCDGGEETDEDDVELGCQYDSDCNDGDECTDDRCNRDTGECSNIVREGCYDPVCGDGVKQPSEQCEGGDSSYCGENEVCNEECLCEPKPVPKAECPDFAHSSMSSCESECSGDCRKQKYEDADCYFCIPKDEPVKVSCDRPYMERPECDKSCDGSCEKTYTTSSGTECFSCIEKEDPVCGNGAIEAGEQCDDGNNSNGDGCDAECQLEPEDTGPSCPSGTVSDLSTCQSQCGAKGGTCVDEDQTGCYGCVVVSCPEGSAKECPSSCSNGCDVVGEQYGVKCYQCKQSCEDVCAQNGYGGPNTDHSSAILSELNGYSCVSGASISIQTATIGSCSCIGEYSLNVNQTPPVCTGTPCGDVTCGSSATCTEGDTTITVNCNWGGWEQIDKHQFRPVVGN